MEPTIVSEFFVLGKSNPIPEIKHQAVLQYKNNKKYLRAFNLIYCNKRVKRIYLLKPILFEETLDVEKLFINSLLDELSCNPAQKTNSAQKKPKAKKRKVDDTARKTAAKNLFTDLGL